MLSIVLPFSTSLKQKDTKTETATATQTGRQVSVVLSLAAFGPCATGLTSVRAVARTSLASRRSTDTFFLSSGSDFTALQYFGVPTGYIATLPKAESSSL